MQKPPVELSVFARRTYAANDCSKKTLNKKARVHGIEQPPGKSARVRCPVGRKVV